jgi:hypothetical protein
MDCRNVKIGSSLSKGVSGGQAKRTNIGIALITNPRWAGALRDWEWRELTGPGAGDEECAVAANGAPCSQTCCLSSPPCPLKPSITACSCWTSPPAASTASRPTRCGGGGHQRHPRAWLAGRPASSSPPTSRRPDPGMQHTPCCHPAPPRLRPGHLPAQGHHRRRRHHRRDRALADRLRVCHVRPVRRRGAGGAGLVNAAVAFPAWPLAPGSPGFVDAPDLRTPPH